MIIQLHFQLQADIPAASAKTTAAIQYELSIVPQLVTGQRVEAIHEVDEY